MEEELENAIVHPNLDYIVNYKGLTPRHLVPILFPVLPLLYFGHFTPLRAIIPVGLVYAVGLSMVAAIVAIQWRQEPEFIDLAWQKLVTPNELSPFKESGSEAELSVTNFELWSDDDEDSEA